MRISLLIAFLVLFTRAEAQESRPIRDDIGFCWDKAQIDRFVRFLRQEEREQFEWPYLIGGISPHDDYLYAGRVYYALLPMIKTKEVVIFGVTHRTVREELGDLRDVIILDEYPAWTGLGTDVGISPLREFIRERLDSTICITSDRAHRIEHSIEALVPFLQYYNPGILVTPIMVTAMDSARMALVTDTLSSIIAGYMSRNNREAGREIHFLISSDANHYGPDFRNAPFGTDRNAHRTGTELDRQIAEEAIAGSMDEGKIHRLTRELRRVVWCGRYSVPFGLLATMKIVEKTLGKTIRGSILRYSDTFTEGVIPVRETDMGITAPFSLKHWVGFFAAGLYVER